MLWVCLSKVCSTVTAQIHYCLSEPIKNLWTPYITRESLTDPHYYNHTSQVWKLEELNANSSPRPLFPGFIRFSQVSWPLCFIKQTMYNAVKHTHTLAHSCSERVGCAKHVEITPTQSTQWYWNLRWIIMVVREMETVITPAEPLTSSITSTVLLKTMPHRKKAYRWNAIPELSWNVSLTSWKRS